MSTPARSLWIAAAFALMPLLSLLRAEDIERKSLLADLKDSIAIHKMLADQRRLQNKLNDRAKRFALRNHCPSTLATFDSLGFLVCQPLPPPPPESPKPEPAKPAK